MSNPWPGNYEGLISLPRLRRTGPPTTATSPVAPIQVTYAPAIPFWAPTVWTLIDNVGSGTTGTYSGGLINVSTPNLSGCWSRALGTLNYTSLVPRNISVLVNVSKNTGSDGGFFIKLDGAQVAIVKVVSLSVPQLPLGLTFIPLWTVPAGSHTLEILGNTDIAAPSRLFAYSGGGGGQCAYTAQFSAV